MVQILWQLVIIGVAFATPFKIKKGKTMDILETLEEACARTGVTKNRIKYVIKTLKIQRKGIVPSKRGRGSYTYSRVDIDTALELIPERGSYNMSNPSRKGKYSFLSFCPKCGIMHDLITTSNTEQFGVYTCRSCGGRFVLDKENMNCYYQGGCSHSTFESLFVSVQVKDFQIDYLQV